MEDVISLQMHGTGTALGDPMEVSAAAAVLVEPRQKFSQPIAFGALKTSLGHAEAVAGTMGLQQAWLVLHSWSLPAVNNLRTVNPHVAFSMSNAKTIQKLQTNRAGGPLPLILEVDTQAIIGTSSFGFSGTRKSIHLCN